jgi:hypothetical protein
LIRIKKKDSLVGRAFRNSEQLFNKLIAVSSPHKDIKFDYVETYQSKFLFILDEYIFKNFLKAEGKKKLY